MVCYVKVRIVAKQPRAVVWLDTSQLFLLTYTDPPTVCLVESSVFRYVKAVDEGVEALTAELRSLAELGYDFELIQQKALTAGIVSYAV